MTIPATILSLLVAISAPLQASAAITLSASPRPGAIATPIETVEYRHAHVAHQHVARPAERDNGYDAHGYWPGHGIDDWSHFSLTHHPGWPCIRGGEESAASAYPSWETDPGCRDD
jgi:hypothetical protein